MVVRVVVAAVAAVVVAVAVVAAAAAAAAVWRCRGGGGGGGGGRVAGEGSTVARTMGTLDGDVHHLREQSLSLGTGM